MGFQAKSEQTQSITAIQAARNREEWCNQPEKLYKGFYRRLTDIPAEDRKKIRTMFNWPHPLPEDTPLCWVCGWTVYHQLHNSYTSRIRAFHTRGNAALWEVGSRWVIKDQPNDNSLGNDFKTQEFLRKQPNLNIPILKEMRRLSAPTDKVFLTLMSRADGVPLNTIWHTISQEQKSNYRNQLSAAIQQWRQFTSPIAQNVDGGIMEDCIIGFCTRRFAPTCKKMGRTTDEWFKNLEPDVRLGLSLIHETKDPQVIEEKFQELKRNFPKPEPYVLTHGDLNLSNIIVKDDKIEAILDWEYAGYLPWWAERWLSCFIPSRSGDELFEPLWADLDGEMDEDTFLREVCFPVGHVKNAWKRVDFYQEHPNKHTKLVGPPFCECKPYVSLARWDDLGNQLEHNLLDTPQDRI